MYYRIGEVHLLQSSTDKAISWLEKARSANSELAEARRLVGDDQYSSIARLKTGYLGVPKIRALFEATFLVGLRKAGVPEE